jgi:cytoplasmic iron level regulating protein YaaA (DUF328/UPF0246 family)
MYILLPPSEGKAIPSDAPALKLGSLVLPGLAKLRGGVLSALVAASSQSRDQALAALGLTAGQAGELALNKRLRRAAAAPAADLYTGVLYDALDLPGLAAHEPAAFTAANNSILIFSALWGVLRPGDRVPHYRCSAGTRLPGLGSVDTLWRRELREPLDRLVGDELVVDLRSGAYAGFWRPGPNSVSVRVVQERVVDGVAKRTVISHFNKATKGRLVRALLLAGAEPKNAGEFAAASAAAGFAVEPTPSAAVPGPRKVDTRTADPSAVDTSAFDVVLRD